MRWPSIAISAGSRVSAAAMVTIGMRMPARPNDCTNGTGTSNSTPRPMPTVTPENTTARTAVCIVAATASGTSRPACELLAEAVDDEQRVVDRDAESDQRHDVGREHRDVGDVGEREHDRQHDRDHEQRQQQRHDAGDEAAEHDDEHDQRQRARDQLGAHQVARAARGSCSSCTTGPPETSTVNGSGRAVATRRAAGTLSCASSWSSNGMLM